MGMSRHDYASYGIPFRNFVKSIPMPDLITENRIRSGVDNFFRECIPTINRQIGKTIEQMIA